MMFSFFPYGLHNLHTYKTTPHVLYIHNCAQFHLETISIVLVSYSTKKYVFPLSNVHSEFLQYNILFVFDDMLTIV